MSLTVRCTKVPTFVRQLGWVGLSTSVAWCDFNSTNLRSKPLCRVCARAALKRPHNARTSQTKHTQPITKSCRYLVKSYSVRTHLRVLGHAELLDGLRDEVRVDDAGERGLGSKLRRVVDIGRQRGTAGDGRRGRKFMSRSVYRASKREQETLGAIGSNRRSQQYIPC